MKRKGQPKVLRQSREELESRKQKKGFDSDLADLLPTDEKLRPQLIERIGRDLDPPLVACLSSGKTPASVFKGKVTKAGRKLGKAPGLKPLLKGFIQDYLEVEDSSKRGKEAVRALTKQAARTVDAAMRRSKISEMIVRKK